MTRTVLVTGAASGIGRAAADAFFADGWNVVAAMRRPEDAAYARIANEAATFLPLPLDVCDGAAVQLAVERTIRMFGGIDVLVNNAGYGPMGPLETMAFDQIERVFATNCLGPIRLIREIVPHMRTRGRGRIINVSSAGGEFTTPFAGSYHASKYALESISDALRVELAPFGIEVVVVQPGPVDTKLASRALDELEMHASGIYRAALAGFATNMRRQMARGTGILAPEQVGKVILAAATAPKPATRYKVGLIAKSMPRLRRLLSDRLWDRIWLGAPAGQETSEDQFTRATA